VEGDEDLLTISSFYGIFILKYKKELKEMWDNEVYKKLPPLQ
jgi:hypothetical protein